MALSTQAKIQSKWVVLAMTTVMLTLSACGGGTTGQTWFNLPSIPVRVQPDGSATVFGINVGPALPAATIQQLQAANVQKLEVRPGYSGLQVLANGEDLPRIEWNAESIGTLQEVVTALPASTGVPGSQIAQYLPVLQQFGLGVALNIPPAEGNAPINAVAWSGEQPMAEEDPGESLLPPLSIGSLAFDANGVASFEGVPLSTLGMSGAALPPDLLQTLQAIGAENISVKTSPSGIDLAVGGKPLPRIAYNKSALERTLNVAGPFVGPELSETLQQVLPMLPGAEVDLNVSLTGEPAGSTVLPKVSVEVGDDGSLSAFGMPVGQFPSDLLAQLNAAGVQQLDVDISNSEIVIAANKEKLPVIEMSDSFLDTFLNDMGPALGIDLGSAGSGVAIVQKILSGSPLQAEVKLPGADGADMPSEVDMSFEMPDTGGVPAAAIHMELTYEDGKLAAINDLSGDALGSLSESFPELPENIGQMLTGMGASQLQLQTEANKLNIIIDGNPLVSLNYDVPSIVNALELAGPFLEGTPLEDPAMVQFLQESILPYAPGSDIDIKINVQ